MVIDLEKYRRTKRRHVANAVAVAVARPYEERMCVNWTPSRGISTIFCYRDPRLMSPHLPDDLASVDIEEFLDRLYSLASQV